jgi:very-short-patch-repair endonuclease
MAERPFDKAYNRTPTVRSHDLRNNPTNAEGTLWCYLRNRQRSGVRFNRQVPIGPYVCDFVARRAGIVIELDGGQHALAKNYDRKRTTFLQQRGYRVIRFWNNEVLENVEGVLGVIEEALKNSPSPSPSRNAGGGK